MPRSPIWNTERRSTGWLRFNVAYSLDPGLTAFLELQIDEQSKAG